MKTLEIDTGTKVSKILIGEKLANVGKYLPHSNVVILTDTNVYNLYNTQFPDFPVVQIGLGESNKTLATIDKIFEEFVNLEVDRSTYILAIGGGIVCDVAGFAASIYMRGLSFGFVSTTLLSQVDASVGGKNGVNFQGFKNMVGVFNQPDFVICDIDMLKTLPKEEYLAGFAEIVKAGAIKNESLFNYLQQNIIGALEIETEVVEELLLHSVQIKADVVEADEREKGERRKLNFGHTFGHALEKLTGMLHGEAVSIGMVMASQVSANLGMLSKQQAQQIKTLLEDLHLPVSTNVPLGNIYRMMRQDKKKEGENIHLILLEDIGNAVVKTVTYKDLEELINDLR
jgi:3-dehydroquinate synthase